MIIIGIYLKLLVIIAIICMKCYNVYNSIDLDFCFSFLLLQIILIIVLMWMTDIRCTLTDLEEQHCDGEEFQPKHLGVLSEKVMRCCLGLHTPCQCMWGSAEMADIRCAFTYLPAQHCRDRQAEVLVPRQEHRRGTRASPLPLPHRRCGGGVVGVVGQEGHGRADSSAALWGRRIPTETSGCSVRESNEMLLGSAHSVPVTSACGVQLKWPI